VSTSWTLSVKWLSAATLLVFLWPVEAQTDPALAARIERAFSSEASAPIPDIFQKHGLPTTAQVGDEASYLFVFLAMDEAPDFRSKVLAKLRLEAKRRAVPRDALIFAEARDRLQRIREQADAKPPTNPELRDEIERMIVSDQEVRQQAGFELQKMMEMDRRHAARLREIVDQYGAPTYAMVGTRAAGDFVVLVQHQTPELRRLVLPKLKANVDAGQADPDGYAMMYDRLRINEGKHQYYGKNLDCGADGRLHETPIEDEAHVSERLAAIGAMRVELYARMVVAGNPPMCGGNVAH